ncbi:NAD(P)-dependent oxidoreductase [Jannaschia sp. R86511]|uniref:NAD(P)-dependent oxidoreductase n=1 Tax=Jannaschia sp. R86511 TaxID=3093853 RepID=UPI0036D28FD7
MRLTVLGATGRTGRYVVAAALAAGHEVTVLARTPTAVPQTLGADADRVTLVPGDLQDEAAVARALAGADAVVSAAGPGRASPPDLMVSAARAVVAQSRAQGVQRLVWLTGAGVRRPGDRPGPADRLIVGVMRLLQGAVLRDSIAAVDVVAASGLDWTVVRAPRLTDGPPAGGTRVVGQVGGGHGTQLPRQDLAPFLVGLAATREWLHQAPVISS